MDEVNEILTGEAATERYAGILGVSHDPLVSSDVIGDSRASIVDLELTRVVGGDLVKVMSWYDNEWGYANQMLREAVSATRGPSLRSA
jgi:glyceraldehyde 3-phosphate dehydrogenase